MRSASARCARAPTHPNELAPSAPFVSIQPSNSAKRLSFRDNVLQISDGPFVESKELIGGIAIMELADMEAAIALCRPYAEIDVRLLAVDD